MKKEEQKHKNQLEMEKLQKEQDEFNGLTHKVFKQDADGARWLGQMKKSFLLNQMVADPSKDSKYAYFREGQNSIPRMIELAINLVEHRK